MEPGDALGIAAQIAVALAGFAGVVVVFRRESIHEWSPADKLRLRFLLTNSILPLGLCMLGLLLLTIKPMPPGIWRWCSGFAFVVSYLFGTFGTAAILLQLYNAVFLGAFWPFFTSIIFQLVTAMFQFARMIL